MNAHSHCLPLVNFPGKLLAPICALVLMLGCAVNAPPVTTHVDAASGLRTDLLAENLLDSPTDPPREVVYLNASRVFKDYTKYTYYFEVSYLAKKEAGFLDIPFGQSLTIVADGETLKFTGSGSLNMRKNMRDGLVQEKALFEATKEQLQKISKAKDIEVRIKGNNGLILRKFNQKNHERVRQFVLSYAT